MVRPPARGKPQIVKPPVHVFHEPPRKSTDEGLPWREDARRKREEDESEKGSNKRQMSKSSAPPLPKPPTHVDPKAKERAKAAQQVEEVKQAEVAELVQRRQSWRKNLLPRGTQRSRSRNQR